MIAELVEVDPAAVVRIHLLECLPGHLPRPQTRLRRKNTDMSMQQLRGYLHGEAAALQDFRQGMEFCKVDLSVAILPRQGRVSRTPEPDSGRHTL